MTAPLQKESLCTSFTLIFIIALVLSSALAAVTILVCRRLGLLDKPGPGKVHERPTPRLGGPAIWIAMTLTLVLTCAHREKEFANIFYAICGGGLLVLLIGVWDDVRGVNAIIKLIGLALATLIMATQGVTTSLCVALPLSDSLKHVLEYVVTLLWVVGVVSAFNAIDNMDGLAGGIAFIAACLFAFVGAQTGQFPFMVVSLALAGAVLGFLLLNRPPAHIFLGDSGAFMLGYTLAAIGALGGWSTHPIKAALVPVLVLSVPLFDLGYIILARWLSGTTKGIGQAITYRGQDHLSHRLVALGFDKVDAVLFILVLSLGVGIMAVSMRNSLPVEAILLTLSAGITYLLLFIVIARVQPRGEGPKAG